MLFVGHKCILYRLSSGICKFEYVVVHLLLLKGGWSSFCSNFQDIIIE